MTSRAESSSEASKAKQDKVISCAECRRLKVKCDRVFPCSSCRRRGLGALCPNMALSARQRKKGSSSSLSTKFGPSFSDLTARIRDLELAVAELHSENSNEPHPLLADTQEDADIEELQEIVGTLKIDPASGKASFFGQTAGMESLYHIDQEEDEFGLDTSSSLEPYDIVKDSTLNPLLPSLSTEKIMKHLESQLPAPLRAWKLCEIYYTCGSWIVMCMPRTIFQDEILVPVYSTTPPSLQNARLTHTDIAILFMVFAASSVIEFPSRQDNKEILPLPNNDEESVRYHQLARAALALGQSTVEEPTISSIRCLLLMVHYYQMFDGPTAPQSNWSLLTSAFSQAINIGLHRRPENWKLDPALAEERRDAFWELNFIASWLALIYGRPPLITQDFYDCDIGSSPEDPGADYYHRARIITSTLLVEVRDLVSNLQQKYSEVLALDRKLREKAVETFGGPLGIRTISPDTYNGLGTPERLQKWWTLTAKELLCVYLHRRYFVKVCLGPTDELASSRYSPSFSAAFGSAQSIILLSRSIQDLEPELFCRFAIFWNHLLAAAIFVGSVVIRHPRCMLASDALKSLEIALTLAHEFFAWTRNCSSSRSRKTLQRIKKIHAKALHSINNANLESYERETTTQKGSKLPVVDKSKTASHIDTTNVAASQFQSPPTVPDLHPSFKLLDDILSIDEHMSSIPVELHDNYSYEPYDTSYGYTPPTQQYPASVYGGNIPQASSSVSYDPVEATNGHGNVQSVLGGLMAPESVYRVGISDDKNWQGFIDGLGVS
ncbi:hypothetical protein M422DRAFT_63270 [Sphaerobolus stellatus SS14]|nr:hypothetical protein M422DRAFT_63270 [Sphaerobolus stellatus SS14]